MNILDKEDYVKGAPDETLIQLAQMPTEEIPQFLVVSEIQRREKMRADYAASQQNPQGTVTDQVIQQGIASLNPNPDPLMNAAMGAPNPMMPQDPMMSQDPMMGQGQTMMAAGGGMMPYRMQAGGGTSFAYPNDLIQTLKNQGLSDEEIYALMQSGEATELYSQNLFPSGSSQLGLTKPIAADASKTQTSYLTDTDFMRAVLADNNPGANPDAGLSGTAKDLLSSVDAFKGLVTKGNLENLTNKYLGEVDRTEETGAFNTFIGQQRELAKQIGKTPDYGSLLERLENMGAERSQRAIDRAEAIKSEFKEYETKAKAETKDDMINQAIIQLGAGIASGKQDLGFSDVGKTIQNIKAKADSELKADRRTSLVDQRQQERFAEVAQQAAEDKMLGLETKQIENKYTAALEEAKFKSGIEKSIFERMRAITQDDRASDAIAIQLVTATERLALDYAKAASSAEIDKNRTRRSVIEGVTKVLEELISRHSSALDVDKANALIKTALTQLNPIIERALGSLPNTSSGQGQVINKQASFANYQDN